MRGKQAAKASRRQAESTAETIATLSSALSEAKKRARDAERAATAVPALRARIRELEADPVPEEVAAWMARIKEARAKQYQRWEEAKPDFLRLVGDLCDRAFSLEAKCDRIEFLFRRYPALWTFLGYRPVDHFRDQALHTQALSADAARRLERAFGLRGEVQDHEELDLATVAADLWDAPQMNLDDPRIRKYLGLAEHLEAELPEDHPLRAGSS